MTTRYVAGGARWELDGISLSTLATWVVAVDEEWPAARGADAVAPSLPGEQFRAKRSGPRRIALTIAVADRDETGAWGGPTRLRTNLDRLAGLVTARSRQLALRRKMPDGTWRQAQVQALSSLALEQPGGGIAKVSVDLHMADPWWRSESDTTLGPLATGSHSVTVPGSAPAHTLTVKFTGPATNPSLTNVTADPDVALSWQGTIPTGDWVTVALPGRRATWKSGASAGWSSVSRSDLFELFPGANALAVSGGGTATVTFKAHWA